MKRFIVILLTLAMVLGLAACSTGQSTEAEKPDEENETAAADTKEETAVPLDGGWEFVRGDAVALPEDVQTAFDKAKEGFTGSDLKPVAYVACQVVSGSNYMILCEATTVTQDPVTSYRMIVIYADLDGNATMTTVKDFDLLSYTEGDGQEPVDGDIVGGWQIPEDHTVAVLPEDAQAAFDKATKKFTGNGLTPMALLGTQIVAGKNYAFLCAGTTVTEEPVTRLQVVVVYEDLDGNAEITSICTIDPANFNE